MNNLNLLTAGAKAQSNITGGIVLLSARELEKMRRVGRLAANLLDYLQPMVQPGISTQELNDRAAAWTKAAGATSAPLGYAPPGHPPFPGSICTSVNEVIMPTPEQAIKAAILCQYLTEALLPITTFRYYLGTKIIFIEVGCNGEIGIEINEQGEFVYV